jgi:ABC-type transport system involved in cytochrome c biogenesis permease subunit
MNRNRSPLFLLVIAAVAMAGRAAGDSPAPVAPPAVDTAALRDLAQLPVLHQGRIKPLDTVARESVRFVTDKSRYRGQEPLLTYLSWIFQSESWYDEPMVKVGYLPLREAVGLDAKRTAFSIQELRDNDKLMALFRTVDDKQRRDEKLDKIENEAQTAGSKLLLVNDAMSGNALRVVPNSMDAAGTWFTFTEVQDAPFFDTAAMRGKLAAAVEAFRGGDGAALAQAGAELRSELARIAPAALPPAAKIAREVQYNRLEPFRKAWILYFVAFVILLVSHALRGRPWYLAGMAALAGGFALQAYGMGLRVYIAGRPPVSNIYESMIFVAAAIVLFALVFEAVYRSRIFGTTAAALGVVTLVLAENLPVSPEITPLVPVLRSTTWLTFHVLTIMLGYSGAFLAGGLAFVGLGCYALGRGAGPFAVRLDKFHYRVVQLTVLFLGTGTILGGVWANQSWGRYWGWDPKETWALISLLVYLVIVHGRFAGWLRRFGTNVASVIGLNMVIMTYYGVNYFLVGLHSYAGGTAFQVPAWVYAFLASEVAFVMVAYFGGAPRRRRAALPTLEGAAAPGARG